MYDDDEVLDLIAGAVLEGRDITDTELAGTAYWQARTEGERAWDELWLSDPATARQRLDSNRDLVRTLLAQAGYDAAPESFVNWLADNWTHGTWSEQQLRTQIVQETDPYAPGASPFAGREIPDGQLVTNGTNFWYRTTDGDFLVTGEGQLARLGGADAAQDIQTAGPEGQYVTQGNRHFLVLADGSVLEATGPGQVAGLQRLYGDPVERPRVDAAGNVDSLIDRVSGTVVDRFGAGGIEQIGPVNEQGAIAHMVEGGPDPEAVRGLGETERVEQLLLEWLGPMFANGYTDQWIAEEAGKLRIGGQGAEDVLVEKLRNARSSALPNYDPNLSYEDIAGVWRSYWRQNAGVDADEASDARFMRLLQLNDAAQAEVLLIGWGLQDGWQPTVDAALPSGLGTSTLRRAGY
jgi:hypothetical protein